MADVMMIARADAAGRPRRPASAAVRPLAVVVQSHPLWPSMAPLRKAASDAAAGECVAFAVPLDAPPLKRLVTLITLRQQRRRAVRALLASGAEIVAQFGVEPSLSRPAWCYELDSAAAEYTVRHMRPRGRFVLLRRIAERCFGCDPGLGGVLVMGKKTC
jgi:hypothetical protein